MKKVFVMIMCIFFVCTGCAKPDNELGEIADVEVEEEEIIEEDVSEAFTLDNGYASLSFNIPAGWEVVYKEANIVKLISGDSTIYIEHRDGFMGYDVMDNFDANYEMSYFAGQLSVQEFNVDGHTYKRFDDQVYVQREGISEVNSPNLKLMRWDYPNLKVYDENQDEGVLSESRYYIFIPESKTVISIVSPADSYEDSCKVIDEMVSTRKAYTEIANMATYDIDGTMVELPGVFSKDKDIYIVPSNSLSNLSECFVYKADIDINTITGEDIFLKVFPEESKYCDNVYMTYPGSNNIFLNNIILDNHKSIDNNTSSNNDISIDNNNSQDNNNSLDNDNIDYTKNNKDIYKAITCVVGRRELGGDRMISHGMMMTFELCEVEDGVIVFGYTNNALKTLSQFIEIEHSH